MKNTKVGVAKTNKYLSVLSRKTIADISQYHSVRFRENGMRFWWYFNVGVGIIIPYSNASISSSFKRAREFKWSSNSKITITETSLSSKKRKDWSLRTLMFWEPVCYSTFDTVDRFEKHCRKTITILVKLPQSWIKWNIFSLQNEIIIISF